MNSKTRIGLVFVVTLVASVAVAANTWYADDDNYQEGCATYEDYEKAGFDGTTDKKAFGTIQAAVDKAAKGDTVLVLPGTYDKGGGTTDWAGSGRVIVEKQIEIRSTKGKHVTHIVGRSHSESEPVGADAMRCLLVAAGARAAVIEGFTLRGGCTGTGASHVGRGGAWYSNNTEGFLVDCVISNSVSSYAAVFQANCVRCEILGNVDYTKERQHVYGCKLVNCLVHDNGTSVSDVQNSTLYNCTLANASCWHALRDCSAYNTIIESSADLYSPLTITNCTHNTMALLAPAADDYRPASDSAADLGGDAVCLADVVAPDGVDLYRDLRGKTFATSGAIHMGCYQSVAVCSGGRIDFTGACSIDGGTPHGCPTYAYPETYPTQYFVKTGNATRPAYGEVSGVTFTLRPPDLNDTVAVMPPAIGGTMTFSLIPADAELYVSVSGDDTTGNGSETAPYKSIQRAIDVADATKKTIVNVGPGTYGIGEAHYPKDKSGNAVTTYMKASVTVYDKCVRIVATKGAESTIIKGTPDVEYADDETLPNCGPKAARCVIIGDAVNRGASLSGFTLTGGATDRTGSTYAIWGGGYLCPGGYGSITDCIVSNNAAGYCAGGFGGTIQRCLFTGNKGTYATAGGGWNSVIFGCVFVDNPASRCTYGAIYNDTYAYHCTLIGEDTSYVYAHNTSEMRFSNSIVVGGNQNCASMKRSGNVIWGGANPDRRQDETYQDPLFVDGVNGDYRIKSISCAVGAGSTSADYYSGYSTTGFGGSRLVFAGGAPLPGAVQELVAAGAEAYVTADNGGFSASNGALGYYDLSQTGTITLSPATGTRPCIGYLVNGVTNLFAELTDGQLTLDPTAVAAMGGVNVKALYDSVNWYVNAADGQDANPGCEAFPLKTLAGGMRNAISGDIVHAAPGDYAEGLMIQSDTFSISSRVVVAEGVTLKADKGADVTFITGADSPTPIYTSGNYKGAGPGAVRCVYLRKNAKVSGFTVRGGRFNGQSAATEDSHAGGIEGVGVSYSVVENCFVTNCCGWRGGATAFVTALNTRIAGCTSAATPAGHCSAFIGCTFGGGMAPVNIINPEGVGICSCTFSDTVTLDRTAANSIVLGTVSASEARKIVLSACLVAEESINDSVRPYVTLDNCIVKPRSEIALNADFSPPFGSPAIDAGSNLLARAELNGLDIAANQRISNGRIDIGAFEYDWRPDYAAAICPGVCIVESATPETELKDGEVSVKGLLETTFRVDNHGRRVRYAIPVRVTGDDTLTVLLNGSVLAELQAGEHVLRFKNDLPENELKFNYENQSGDDGIAFIGRSEAGVPGCAIIVR